LSFESGVRYEIIVYEEIEEFMQENLKTIDSIGERNKIRVCHITISLSSFGGAERMLVRLLLADPESTNQNMVLVLRHAGAWGKRLQAAGVIVHELGMDSIWEMPRVFFQLKKLIALFHPDIVQTWMYHADFLGGLAAYFSGYKNIIWGIRRTSLSLSDSKITLLIMKMCALLSHWVPKKIISVAEAGKRAHVAAGYDGARIVVIPNGFDFHNIVATPAQRIALRQACHFSNDDVVVGCVARFHPAKGHHNFVKTAAIVARINTEVRFLLVGHGCDTNNAELMGWLKEYSLQGRFVLLGERDDVPICLAAMDIFCMPSCTEGFPNGLGEAMAMGLPCVATDVGDTAVLAGDTAILVPAEDEQALARGLLEVIALSKEQRNDMGKRSKEHVTAEFSIEKACERFNAIYQEIVSSVEGCL
jgi:glycosyltransferase involved in cell wall biosynthesis